MQANDRAIVTEAARRLELAMQYDPTRAGELRETEERRIAIEPPLAILFTVVPADSLVVVTRVRLQRP